MVEGRGGMIGFDVVVVAGVLAIGAFKAVAWIRYDIGRGDRLRTAREARLSY